MLLFLKGFIIGIGKIIPGVSGAMLAINFNVYERVIDTLTNFSSDWKKNLSFLLKLGFGIILSIILCSNIVIYLLNNHKFITMMFFIGLILGGTYNFSHKIKYQSKGIYLLIITMAIFIFLSIGNINNNYLITNTFWDNIIFFIGGFIEIAASIIPGISGTALHMILGIYDDILKMISMIYDFSYVLEHINLYLSYGLGMLLSLIMNLYLINYLIKKYRNTAYLIILGLSLSSIIFLFIITFSVHFSIMEFILGIMLLFIGLLISCILQK